MGTPLGPKYIPYTYMDPLGLCPLTKLFFLLLLKARCHRALPPWNLHRELVFETPSGLEHALKKKPTQCLQSVIYSSVPMCRPQMNLLKAELSWALALQGWISDKNRITTFILFALVSPSHKQAASDNK